MRKSIAIVIVLAMSCLMLNSCFKDEAPNTECDILNAWVGDEWASHFNQPTDMRISDVPSGESTIVFTVRWNDSIPEMPVFFNLTPGATIEPASGSVHDFTKGPVTYTVTSEDGKWQRTYKVAFRGTIIPEKNYHFEHAELNDKGKFQVWYEMPSEGVRNDIWATGNEGYNIARPNAKVEDYPSVADANGYKGNCVKLTTCATGSWGRTFKKPIAAGNLFLGKFNSRYALTNTLMCTEMGIPFIKIPLKLTGYYKYKPGEIFTDKDNKEVPGRVDEPNIYSVLYLNHDANGESVVLHGDDVLSSPLIVRKAIVTQLPATDVWTPFEMIFEGTTPIDEELLKMGGYSLALVFSSSKTGDTFEGAVGSTLYIDEIEFTYQEEGQP